MWGATPLIGNYPYINEFQSTHPCGVRQDEELGYLLQSDFNPRTHVGCDQLKRIGKSYQDNFNPRTHVGCDYSGLISFKHLLISIHAPMWGATKGWLYHGQTTKISIHAPMWGATITGALSKNYQNNFNPRTHVGCDNLLLNFSTL